jgi:hypothetical protein
MTSLQTTAARWVGATMPSMLVRITALGFSCPVMHRSTVAENYSNPRGRPPEEAWQISGSGSGRRKGTGINGLLVGGSAVQFDKVDQHHPIRRLTVVFGFGKNGALVG